MKETPSGNASREHSSLEGFLTGVKVLDLSQYIPGPMATLFLADMGADVLKIEPPHGDEMQLLGPRDVQDRPIFYRAMNAGKTVRRMNLKEESQRADFLKLVAQADVVVEGFRPGVIDRLGIGYEVLKRANPTIILCSISGYGAGGSLSAKAGHDANYLALMGTLHRNGDVKPSFFDPPVSDVAGSLFAAMLILGALHGRTRTGRGCDIDLALADTVMPLQMMQVAGFGASGIVPGRGESYLNGGAAYYQVYTTADDRHIILGAVEPKFWAAFCQTAGRPDWLERHGDPFPQKELQQEVAMYFATMTAAQAAEQFHDSDCCFSAVNDLGEALSEPHIAERRLVRPASNGELQALLPVWVNGAPPATRDEPRFQTDNVAADRSPRSRQEKVS